MIRSTLDLRSDPPVARCPNREVGVDAIHDREHDRERAGHVHDGQLRDLLDDLRVDRTNIGHDVRRARLTHETLEARARPARSGDGGEDHGTRQAGEEREREQRAAPPAPIERGPRARRRLAPLH